MFHRHIQKYLSAIIVMALILVSSAVADMVLLDEYWTHEIVNNGVRAMEIDTLETGDPTQAKSGEFSALLENEWGWPSVRFRGGARVVLSEIPPGDSEVRVWYRTDGWDGKWRLEVWLYNYHPSTPIPLKVLEGMLDGGGENGKLIADNEWHQATAILQKGDGYGGKRRMLSGIRSRQVEHTDQIMLWNRRSSPTVHGYSIMVENAQQHGR